MLFEETGGETKCPGNGKWREHEVGTSGSKRDWWPMVEVVEAYASVVSDNVK